MAAAQGALNNYMNNVLLITTAAVRSALNVEGLQSLDDFVSLSEKDIDDICSNARKPGGLIPNPAYDPTTAVAGIGPTMANPGVQIGHLHVKRLKMLRFYIVHLRRIQRSFTAAGATLAQLTNVYALHEQEDEEAEIKDLPDKLVSVDKVRYTLDNIDNYIIKKRGVSGAPLAYVVREDVALPLAADDPGFGLPSHAEEMIRRAPHTGIYYEQDNKAVWDIIRHVTHEGPGWSWVQSYQRKRDGRSAYLSMKSHYLGDSFTARLRSGADKIMESTFYDGKSRAFTFERYCEVLKGAFTDVESTGEVVSEERKVRLFLKGLSDPRLSQAVSQVVATPTLKEKFDNAVNFVAQFLDESRSYTSSKNQRNVSGFSGRVSGRGGGRSHDGRGRGRGGRGRGRGRGNRDGGRGRGYNKDQSGVDRYYNAQEWSQLSHAEQTKIRETRDKKRNVQAVGSRNVRSRFDDDTEPSTPTSTITSDKQSGDHKSASIGMVMSQRNRNF